MVIDYIHGTLPTQETLGLPSVRRLGFRPSSAIQTFSDCSAPAVVDASSPKFILAVTYSATASKLFQKSDRSRKTSNPSRLLSLLTNIKRRHDSNSDNNDWQNDLTMPRLSLETLVK